jgi:hypothetical protein
MVYSYPTGKFAGVAAGGRLARPGVARRGVARRGVVVPAAVRRRVSGGSPDVLCHLIPSNHILPASGYDVDASLM